MISQSDKRKIKHLKLSTGYLHNEFRCTEVLEIPGGCSAKKYIPLLGRQRKTPTLSGTEFAKPYPYWHKIWAQIHTLTGTNPQKG